MPTILIKKLPLIIIKCSKCMFCLEILVNHTMEIYKNSVPRKTYDKDTFFFISKCCWNNHGKYDLISEEMYFRICTHYERLIIIL